MNELYKCLDLSSIWANSNLTTNVDIVMLLKIKVIVYKAEFNNNSQTNNNNNNKP